MRTCCFSFASFHLLMTIIPGPVQSHYHNNTRKTFQIWLYPPGCTICAHLSWGTNVSTFHIRYLQKQKIASACCYFTGTNKQPNTGFRGMTFL